MIVMLLGIDVDGTFTDAVLLSGGRIAAKVKKPTIQGALLPGILAILDEVLAGRDASQITLIGFVHNSCNQCAY